VGRIRIGRAYPSPVFSHAPGSSLSVFWPVFFFVLASFPFLRLLLELLDQLESFESHHFFALSNFPVFFFTRTKRGKLSSNQVSLYSNLLTNLQHLHHLTAPPELLSLSPSSFYHVLQPPLVPAPAHFTLHCLPIKNHTLLLHLSQHCKDPTTTTTTTYLLLPPPPSFSPPLSISILPPRFDLVSGYFPFCFPRHFRFLFFPLCSYPPGWKRKDYPPVMSSLKSLL